MMKGEVEQSYEKKTFLTSLKALYSWSYWILLTLIVIGSIVYKEWLTGALFLSIGISNKLIKGKTRLHRITAVLLLIVIYALAIAYFYTKAKK